MFPSHNNLGICNFVELKQNYSYGFNYTQMVIAINARFIVNAPYFKNRLIAVCSLLGRHVK